MRPGETRRGQGGGGHGVQRRQKRGLERHIRANRPRVERAQRAVQWQGINCPSGRAIAPEFSRGANAIIGCLSRQDNYDGIVGGIVGGGGTGGIIWKHVCPGVDVRVLWASTLVRWRYDNKFDGSAACPPVTRFSSPG